MKGFAWASFGLAVIAGAGLAATNPGLVQVLAVVAALGVLVMDIVKDRTPNQSAVIVAIVLPSLIAGMNGKLADKIEEGLKHLWDWSAGWLGDWSGVGPTFGAAVVAVTLSVIISRRSMPKSSMGR